jgi:hypothetical protein
MSETWHSAIHILDGFESSSVDWEKEKTSALDIEK